MCSMRYWSYKMNRQDLIAKFNKTLDVLVDNLRDKKFVADVKKGFETKAKYGSGDLTKYVKAISTATAATEQLEGSW